MQTDPKIAEQKAIASLKRGNLVGLETLVIKYQVKAVRAAYLIVFDRAEAEDIVQNAFINAYQKIDQFDDQRPFGPWFLKSVIHAAIKAARRQKKLVPFKFCKNGKDDEADNWLLDPDSLPEDLAEKAETRQRIRQAITRLTPDQRAAVMLRYFQELSGFEMTQEMQRPLTTVKWWLHQLAAGYRSS